MSVGADVVPATSSSTKRLIPLIAWAHVAMVAGGVGWIYFSAKSERAVADATLPIYKKIKGFGLEDADGQPFSMLQMKGKVFVVSFVCATCDEESGRVVSHAMRQLQSDIAEPGDVEFVVVSVEPDIDTPEKLRDFRDRLGVSTGWHFLTGDRKETYSLMKNNFMYAALQGSAGASLDATTDKLALVDQSGFLRGVYQSRSLAEMEQLRLDVNFLVDAEKVRP